MATPYYPLNQLAEWCRTLRHQLAAGVSATRALSSLSERGPRAIRLLSARLQKAVVAGRSIGETLDAESAGLPSLFAPMVRIGDETGNLPEILAELEAYLRDDDRLRREFRQQTFVPRLQLFAAIFIVAGLILILGMIASGQGVKPITVFGLAGPSGAMIFLTATLGPIAAFWLLTKTVLRSDSGKRRLRAIANRIPGLGAALFALAMSRLCLALQLTLNSSLSTAKALRLSFTAADDPNLIARLDAVLAAIKRGEPLHDSLAHCDNLPAEFLEILATAEEAGLIPEAMQRQSHHYREAASDRLKVFAQLAGMAVWVLVAGFIIFTIFRIASIYLNALKI